MIPWLTILFIVLAAIFKACADTLTHHFDTSIFKWKDRRFWDPETSWKYAHYFAFTKYKIDAWHLAMSGMVICFSFAIALHHPYTRWWIELIAAGMIYNLSFNLFYNKIFR